MKKNVKRIQISLLVLCLFFAVAGCGEKKEKSSNNSNSTVIAGNETATSTNDSVGTTATVKVPKPEIDNTVEYASIVEISINPYFRVYLDADQKVLKVESLNDDAKEVCSKLEVSNKPFDDVFTEILEESVNQGYLTDGKKIEVQVVKNEEEVYAPDIVQHTLEIANDVVSNHSINADVAIAMSEEVVKEQSDSWGENDLDVYVENAPVLDIAEDSKNPGNYDEGIPNNDGNESEPEICKTCNGDGTIPCEACDAKGDIDCAECNGEGRLLVDCDKCADGLKLCENCNGNYESVFCSTCGGDGLLEGKCGFCKGSGKCVSCGGTGTEQRDDGTMGSCHTCNGDGLHRNIFWGKTQPCHGNAPCNSCPGTGYSVCRQCYDFDGYYSDHPGYVECDCEGGKIEGDCPSCDGMGRLTCEKCNGNREITCPNCGGN